MRSMSSSDVDRPEARAGGILCPHFDALVVGGAPPSPGSSAPHAELVEAARTYCGHCGPRDQRQLPVPANDNYLCRPEPSWLRVGSAPRRGRMRPINDAQVRLLRTKLMAGHKQESAAAAAGMCTRSARNWRAGALPSETKKARDWRTRKDPFAEVWEQEVVPLLRRDEAGILDAKTVLAELNKPVPRFASGQVRTLQRRIRTWRALYGPEKEVRFEQDHPSLSYPLKEPTSS